MARAIIATDIPVISAVGHESDLLVSDMVADVRASTPSNAIERCVPDYNAIQMYLGELNQRLDGASIRQFSDVRNKLKLLSSMLKAAPMAGITNVKIKIQSLASKLNNISKTIIANEISKISNYEASLNAVHPQRVLERGYSMVQNESGEVLTAVNQLQIGQKITMNFADGVAAADIYEIESKKK